MLRDFSNFSNFSCKEFHFFLVSHKKLKTKKNEKRTSEAAAHETFSSTTEAWACDKLLKTIKNVPPRKLTFDNLPK